MYLGRQREKELFVSWDYIISGLGRIRHFFKLTTQLSKLLRVSDGSTP